MIVHLPVHSTCTACPLYENSKNPGLPTRAFSGNKGSDTALLLLGKAPAYEEDKNAAVFTGESGVYLDKVYIKGFRLVDFADVYLQNAVRCRLPVPDMAVPGKSVSACGEHLRQDVAELARAYKEVVVLCLGPDAAKAVVGGKANFNTFEQGTEATVGEVKVKVFATYNPAILSERKDPSKVLAIMDHLQLLKEYLQYKEFRYKISNFQYRKGEPLPDIIDDSILALDTETYGAVSGYPTQRFFHPAKSIYFDKVDPADLVLVGSVACRTKGELWACSYDLKNSKELPLWQEVSDRIKAGSTSSTMVGPAWKTGTPSTSFTPFTLAGQNFAFDLLMLRSWSSKWRDAFTPFVTNVEDLMVWNFLENDQRPERSLKPLSRLLGVTTYEHELSLKTGERYPSTSDGRLHTYAAKDALATLICRDVLRARIADRFGTESPKLSPWSQQWFSDVIWLCTDMAEQGIHYSRERLERELTHQLHRISQLDTVLKERYGLILAGKGSPKSKAEFVTRCWQELDIPVAAKTTKVKKEIAADSENLNTILDNGDPRAPLYKGASLWGRHTTKSKLVSSYLEPMLGLAELKAGKPAKKPSKKNPQGTPAIPAVLNLKSALCQQTAYPTWYPVPSFLALSSSGGSQQGGTRQVRIVAQNHGAQTEPPTIWKTMTSRYGPDGIVAYRDGSQIELRVGGGLSFDPEMLQVYLQKRNFHTESASKLFGFYVDKKKFPLHYHGGKTANFLRLFRGQAKKLQQTILKDCKVFIPIEQCDEFIAADKEVFNVFYKWQDYLIERAVKYGFLEVPLIGVSRSFLGGRSKVLATYIPDICNVLVQSVAAALIQSSQVELRRRQGSRQIHLVKNVYDAGYYDMHRDEYQWWLAESEQTYRDPPYLQALKDGGYWTEMPLDSETKIVYNGGSS